MLELKKEGLYIAQGPKINVLIRVVGAYPLLSIIGGASLNELYATGKVRALTDKSPEIQDILVNPHRYTFDLPSISSSIENENGLEDTTRNIDNIEELLEEWKDAYVEIKKLYGNTIKLKMKMVAAGYAISQADNIITRIEKNLRFGI